MLRRVATLLLLLSAAVGEYCLPPARATTMAKNYNMNGKVVVATGASPGTITHWGAIGLALAGARVIVLGHSPGSMDRAVQAIAEVSGSSKVSGLIADHASFASVREAASSLLAVTDTIDVRQTKAFLPPSPRCAPP